MKNEKKKEWSKEEYKKFEEAVELYKDASLGNKKIEKYMGDEIDPIKIRQEKIRHSKGRRRKQKEEI